METNPLRVVQYVNQFFGGIGGEDKASLEPQIKEGPVGPGKAVQQALGNRGQVVATVICGDNYFAERMESAAEEVTRLILPFRPDGVVAGPAFNAGRYGIACGAVCKAVGERINVPAVTGMYKENPGVDLFRKNVYIIESEDSAKRMAEVVGKMVSLLTRLVAHQKIGKPAEEGYFARGLLVNEPADQRAAQRVVSMLLAKLRGEPFKSEVSPPSYDRVRPAPGIRDIRSAIIALVTDGGLVPKGNPDSIEPERATRFGSYSIEGVYALTPGDYDVSHAGYTPIYVLQDPHRLVPLDVMREIEAEGVIGKLYEKFYSTSGCGSIVENAKKMGQAIAKELKTDGVSGVILTST